MNSSFANMAKSLAISSAAFAAIKTNNTTFDKHKQFFSDMLCTLLVESKSSLHSMSYAVTAFHIAKREHKKHKNDDTLLLLQLAKQNYEALDVAFPYLRWMVQAVGNFYAVHSKKVLDKSMLRVLEIQGKMLRILESIRDC
jgi:hypothetical protein